MYKGVIFDLDGTLIDTIKDLASASNYTLKYFKKEELEIDVIKGYVGNGIKKLIDRLFDNNTPKEAFDIFISYYLNHVDVYTKPYDGMVQTLKLLKEKGIKIAVLTNKIEKATKELLDKFFNGLIDIFIGDNLKRNKKPSPDGVYEILDYFKLKNNEVMYVGDSLVDMETSINAHLDFMFVKWGFLNKKDYKLIKSKYQIAKPIELLNYF